MAAKNVTVRLTIKEAEALDRLVGCSYQDLDDIFYEDAPEKAAATRACKKLEEAMEQARVGV